MANKNSTGSRKYDAFARDFRVALVRVATLEEAEGEKAVIVELSEGVTSDGSSRFVAFSVTDARAMLETCAVVELAE